MYAYVNYKLSWGGNIYNNADIWSNSIHLGDVVGDVLPWVEASSDFFLTSLSGPLSDWFRDPRAGISGAAQLEWIKLARIDRDGKYTDDAVIYDYDSSITGGNSAAIAPQLTTAITFDTGATRGLAKTGRIFPPLTGVPSSTGRVASQAQALMANAAAGLIADIRNAALVPLVGVSPIVASNQRQGQNRYITNVRVGNVIDTQRSRRNAMVEEYVTAPIPAVS